jgi:hypothetical protein
MIERVITLLANEDHCFVSILSYLTQARLGPERKAKTKRSTRGMSSFILEMLTRILHQLNLEFSLLVAGDQPGLAAQAASAQTFPLTRACS